MIAAWWAWCYARVQSRVDRWRRHRLLRLLRRAFPADLATEQQPGRRAVLLDQTAAALDRRAARARILGVGDVRTFEDAAELVRLLARVEESVDMGLCRLPLEGGDLLGVGRPVLARMAETTRPRVRAAYLRELHYAVEPVAGVAAELIRMVPSPGHVGFDRSP